MKTRLRKAFSKTAFADSPMVCVAANPAEGEPQGLQDLVKEVSGVIPKPTKAQAAEKDLLMFVDHCFPIKGQGTVLTGTLLQGSLHVGQSVLFPSLQQQKKVCVLQYCRPGACTVSCLATGEVDSDVP